ncbi:hypothetical protein AAZX31_09G218100 [Glycine max]|uniref:ZF-HD dimerization-type domain-containing protein n=2 Tax=Glycine subgen. Soja TaxID=1462606 RepID=I1L5Y1_SOYBN|nr:hypothetical protein JHK87_025957 [Glycine soja]KAG5008086.1 hypothetical protein JHK85_026628 [Glycine max]KAG5134831.1 hypothetical protein JHK82_026019 [Glycine max]KAH1044510.1 hypothetical protein GYH30_025997 [Glycine max]KHN11604.1 ZF-HD homeobox protein [Glycine soja]
MRRMTLMGRNGPQRCPNNALVTIVRYVRYRDCRRNHVCHLGGHTVDGCTEFIPSGSEGTDTALICAACGCHRNFHRREEYSQLVCGCTSHPSTSGA